MKDRRKSRRSSILHSAVCCFTAQPALLLDWLDARCLSRLRFSCSRWCCTLRQGPILPKQIGSPLQSWLSGEPTVRLGLADRVRTAAPITREAILYMISRQCLVLDEGCDEYGRKEAQDVVKKDFSSGRREADCAGSGDAWTIVRRGWNINHSLHHAGNHAMSMQIRSIIVYDRSDKMRVVPLRLNEVNIITGKSGTGKTALSDIIDYCLGRTTCNVALGVIRNTVAWYALHLQFPDVQAFVAPAKS